MPAPAHRGRRIARDLLFAIAGHFAGVGITRVRIASLHFDFVGDIDRLLPAAHLGPPAQNYPSGDQVKLTFCRCINQYGSSLCANDRIFQHEKRV